MRITDQDEAMQSIVNCQATLRHLVNSLESPEFHNLHGMFVMMDSELEKVYDFVSDAKAAPAAKASGKNVGKGGPLWDCSEALNEPMIRVEQSVGVLGGLLGEYHEEGELCATMGMMQDALIAAKKELSAAQNLILDLHRK